MFNCDTDHEYLEIPGKDWKFLSKGEVNAEHLTLGDWLANQKQAHGVLSDGPYLHEPGDSIERERQDWL